MKFLFFLSRQNLVARLIMFAGDGVFVAAIYLASGAKPLIVSVLFVLWSYGFGFWFGLKRGLHMSSGAVFEKPPKPSTRKKLELLHVQRALLVGNPKSDLLALLDTAPALGELILDRAYAGADRKKIYSDAVLFLHEQAQHGPLIAPVGPPVDAMQLSRAIIEAKEIYP